MVQDNIVNGLACQELCCSAHRVNPLDPQAHRLEINLYENLKEKVNFGLGKSATAAVC